MVTRCRDDPENVQWKLIKMGEGAPAEGGSRALLDWAKSGPAQSAGVGVDQAELDRFVKRVVTLFTEGYVAKGGVPSALPEACALLRDAHEGFHRSVDIFDFSERNTMRHASEVVTAIDGRELDNRMLVLPVGDALQVSIMPASGSDRQFEPHRLQHEHPVVVPAGALLARGTGRESWNAQRARCGVDRQPVGHRAR